MIVKYCSSFSANDNYCVIPGQKKKVKVIFQKMISFKNVYVK